MSDFYPDPENLGYEDDVPIDAPDIVPPSAGTPGNIPTFVLPDAEVAYHTYELDITDTQLVWQPGSPIDTGLVRQYLVDRGYVVTSVDVQIGDDGQPTGILTVRTNPVGTPIYPPVVFTIADESESSTTAVSVAQVKITATAIDPLPEDVIFAGEVSFAAALRRDVVEGEMGIVPVIDGVDGAFVGVDGDAIDVPVRTTLPLTGLAGGTAPTFGLKFRGGVIAGTTYIRDVVISGTFVDSLSEAATQIDPAEWAEYAGTRYQGIVETVVTWTSTAEGAITPKPDLPRIAALWMHLEKNGYDVKRMRGGWNFTQPPTAPASPELVVTAVGTLDSEVIAAFLYSTIVQHDLDAFRTQWAAVTSTTTMERVVSASVTVDEFEFSAQTLFTLSGQTFSLAGGPDFGSAIINTLRLSGSLDLVPPLREGDYLRLQTTAPSVPGGISIGYYFFRRSDWPDQDRPESWGYLGYHATSPTAYIDGNPGATALGTNSEAPAPNALAVGVGAKALADGSMAIGPNTVVNANSPNAKAIGEGVEIGEDGIALPDRTIWQASTFEIRQSDRTGATRIVLHSLFSTGVDPETGTIGIDANGNLTINGFPVFRWADLASIRTPLSVKSEYGGSTANITTPQNVPGQSGGTVVFGTGTWAGQLTLECDMFRSVTGSPGGGSGYIEVQLDGVTVPGSTATPSFAFTAALTRRRIKAVFDVTGVAAGSHTFNVRFRGEGTAGTTYVDAMTLSGEFRRSA